VTNPVTDTPSVNPLEQESLLPPVQPKADFLNSEDLQLRRATKKFRSGNARVVEYSGNVDARLGIIVCKPIK
jgi:hypothetical protein